MWEHKVELREHRAMGTQSYGNTELNCGNRDLWEQRPVGIQICVNIELSCGNHNCYYLINRKPLVKLTKGTDTNNYKVSDQVHN